MEQNLDLQYHEFEANNHRNDGYVLDHHRKIVKLLKIKWYKENVDIFALADNNESDEYIIKSFES